MLALMCDVGGLRCAVNCEKVIEVIARVRIEPFIGSNGPLVGIARYRGLFIPIFDLNKAWTGTPCPQQWGSRIIVIDLPLGDSSRTVGILVENVETVSFPMGHQDTSSQLGPLDWGRFCQDAHGVYQLLEMESLEKKLLPHLIATSIHGT